MYLYYYTPTPLINPLLPTLPPPHQLYKPSPSSSSSASSSISLFGSRKGETRKTLMALRVLGMVVLILLCLSPCLHARKLLSKQKERMKVFNLEPELFLNALPKGKVPPSAPSKRGNSMVVDQKLFAMHFARLDRILKSVPSPGMGH